MSWTQPICLRCFEERHPGKRPVTVKEAEPEHCCVCGDLANQGIWIRIDPRTVKFPSE